MSPHKTAQLAEKYSDAAFNSAVSLIHSWQSGVESYSFNTSGSTGSPKSIVIPRWKMELSAKRTIGTLDLKAGQTALLCMSPDFIGGAMMIVRALLTKMHLIIATPDKNPLKDVSEPFHFTAMVPMQLMELLRSKNEAQIDLLNKAEHILLGGSALSSALEGSLNLIRPICWSTYGMTETVSHIALRQLNGVRANPYFRVLRDVKIKTGKQQQLCIKDTITDDRWLQTNDIVELLSPSTFRWLGRLDSVINSGGIKVHAEAVESSISSLMQLWLPESRYFITGTSDATYTQVVTLVIESTPDLSGSEMIRRIKESGQLSKYETPKRVLFLEKFPETGSGKIDKQRIIKELL